MDATRADGRTRVIAQDYQLEVRQDPPRVVLADRAAESGRR